jgi:hypothetical protein
VTPAPPSTLSVISRCVIALIGIALASPACSGPTAPDSLTSAPLSSSMPGMAGSPASVLAATRVVGTVQLVNGTFTVRFNGPDGAGTVSGTYTGQASVPDSGKTTAALSLTITSKTGFGSNTTGASGEGSGGAFVGEGDFTLSLSLGFSGPKDGFTVKTLIRGSSQVSCVNSHTVVTLRGSNSASAPRLGQIDVEFRHEAGGCNA